MFYITISNGLLKDDHPKRMGMAVWEFMWCLDKTTMIDAKGTGWVLGKKPIHLSDIAKDLGSHEVTVSEHLTKLTELGYIQKITAPYGLVIGVNKAKKRFNQTAKPRSEKTKPASEKTKPNKTVSVDKDNKTDTHSAQSAEEVWTDDDLSRYINEKLIGSPQPHIRVIGNFVAWKEPSTGTNPHARILIRSRKEIQALIPRYSRKSSELLKTYDEERINRVMELLALHARFKWELETIGKYIHYSDTEIISQLKGRAPINSR